MEFKQVVGRRRLALALPQASKGVCGAEFERFGLLGSRDFDGLLETGLGVGDIIGDLNPRPRSPIDVDPRAEQPGLLGGRAHRSHFVGVG